MPLFWSKRHGVLACRGRAIESRAVGPFERNGATTACKDERAQALIRVAQQARQRLPSPKLTLDGAVGRLAAGLATRAARRAYTLGGAHPSHWLPLAVVVK